VAKGAGIRATLAVLVLIAKPWERPRWSLVQANYRRWLVRFRGGLHSATNAALGMAFPLRFVYRVYQLLVF
jgi:hypothetical protein